MIRIEKGLSREVLIVLSINRGFTRNQINTKLSGKKNNLPNIIKTIDNLEKSGLVEKDGEITVRGSVRSTYKLTYDGIGHALKSNYGARIEILNNYQDMFLIARKLPLFEAINITEHVLAALDVELSNTLCYQNLDRAVILRLLSSGCDKFPKKYDKFLEYCKNDKALNNFIQVIAKEENERLSKTMSWLQSWYQKNELNAFSVC